MAEISWILLAVSITGFVNWFNPMDFTLLLRCEGWAQLVGGIYLGHARMVLFGHKLR